jgi:2-polyprenyl-3-methyl-5-hydroxy-6-metoxy-1,4-benzoquinol methylase
VPALRLLAEDELEARAVDVTVDTQHAFDGVAATYHRSNVENRILAAMRERLWRAVERHVPAGSHLLDLGCGPGTDEEYFAAHGYRVTATDWSPAMVHEARLRVGASGLDAKVDVHHLGIQEIDRLAPATFDAACSNLGPLNCVPDLAAAARRIADRVRPGGMFIASVIGRMCPWEIALYASRRDWTRVRVRFARELTPVPLDGGTVWTRYYSPAVFERTFADAGFAPVERRALGLLVPPPYMLAFADRHPVLIRGLQQIEDVIGWWPGVRACGDHFLVVMRKTGPAEAGRHGDAARRENAEGGRGVRL